MKEYTPRTVEPIAYIITDYKEKFGIPRQSGRAENSLGKIVFLPKFRSPDAIRNIEEFDYLWLIFDFSESHIEKFRPTVRPPRLGGNVKTGVFASRSPYRPNSLGLSSVKLLGVEKDDKFGFTLLVEGADLLDGTPIFDIKPYIPFSDSHEGAKYGFSEENKDHAIDVELGCDLPLGLDEKTLETALRCIRDDPRPAYKDDPEKVYGMRYVNFDFKFKVTGGIATVFEIAVIKENDA